MSRAIEWWQIVEEHAGNPRTCLPNSTSLFLLVKVSLPLLSPLQLHDCHHLLLHLFPLLDCFTTDRAHCFSQDRALSIVHIPRTPFRIQFFTFKNRNVHKNKKGEKSRNHHRSTAMLLLMAKQTNKQKTNFLTNLDMLWICHTESASKDLITIFSFRFFWYHEHCFTAIVLSHFSCVQLLATPWTVVLHAPLSTGFSRQEYWGGLTFRPPADLPDPGMELASLISPTSAGGFFTTRAPWEAPLLPLVPSKRCYISIKMNGKVLLLNQTSHHFHSVWKVPHIWVWGDR